MFRRYWRSIIAVVLAAFIFSALGIVAYHFYNAAEQRNSEYDYQPAAKSSGSVTGIAKTPAKAYQPNCKNPQTYENADLCAQWAAVEQVGESNRLTSLNARMAVASLVATAVATFLLLWTLWETRETSRRELRAYLFIKGNGIGLVTKGPNRGKVVSFIEINNSGSTPAHRVRHWSAINYGPLGEDQQMVAPKPLEAMSESTIPPNGENTADRVLLEKLTPAQRDQIHRGETAIFVFGAIEYQDVFDRWHRTDYRLFYSGRWPISPNPLMRFCNEGNEAT